MITGFNHLTLSVKSLNVSLVFYTELLGLKPQVRWQQGAYLSAPNLWLCLMQGESKPSADYSHVAFSVDADTLLLLQGKLAKAGHKFWQENSSEGDSCYFIDPDGHKLELHVGDLQTRLAALREAPYETLHWY